MNATRTLPILALLCLITACSGGSEPLTTPEAPNYGIYTIGTGNRSDSTTTQSSTASDTASRGIYTIGTGN